MSPSRIAVVSIIAAFIVAARITMAGGLESAHSAVARGDYAAAFRLYRPLAEQGSAEAQTQLGLMYFMGQGVPLDFAAALKWFRKGTDQGDAKAQFWVGRSYLHGEGVSRDYVQAHRWFNLAASSYPPGSDRVLAITNRDIAAEYLKPAQLAEAQQLEVVTVDADTLGIWEIAVNGGRWVWEIDPDGTYKFHSEAPDGVAPHAGKFSANGGHWSLQATNGYSDSGTYKIQSSGAWLATGRLGTGAWHHPANAVSK